MLHLRSMALGIDGDDRLEQARAHLELAWFGHGFCPSWIAAARAPRFGYGVTPGAHDVHLVPTRYPWSYTQAGSSRLFADLPRSSRTTRHSAAQRTLFLRPHNHLGMRTAPETR